MHDRNGKLSANGSAADNDLLVAAVISSLRGSQLLPSCFRLGNSRLRPPVATILCFASNCVLLSAPVASIVPLLSVYHIPLEHQSYSSS
jgi:hypothetical protein